MTPTDRKAKRAAAKAARMAAGKRLPPRTWLRPRIEPFIIAGESDETIARRFAQLFDSLLDFDRTVPAPFGTLIEALDGEVYYAIALPIVRRVRRELVKAQAA